MAMIYFSERYETINSTVVFSFLMVLALLLSGCGIFSSKQLPVYPVWILQESGTDVSLRGICAVNERVAWASGENGTCLRTTDGGNRWQPIPVPGAEDRDFRDIQAWDENTAIVMAVGEPARIFKTTNGGRYWSERYFDDTPGVFLDAMAFWDDKNGVAFGDPVEGGTYVLSTRDGGITWERISPDKLPAPMPGEAGFAASGTCICVADQGHAWFGTGGDVSRVIRTSDQGETWEAFSAPLISGKPSTGIFSMAFSNARQGVVVGGDYENAELAEKNAAWTGDSGKTWTLSASPPPGYRSSVAYVQTPGGELLIAVGPGGSDFSRDLGKTWKPFGKTGFHSVSFSGVHGWASGADGRIAKFKITIPPATP